MARGLNRVTLIGNLGNDPELRYTADGVAMATASLAVNGFRRTSEGGREESVEWFRLVFFDRQAETISTYGAKGKPIFVEGRLQTRPYADRNGVIRTAIEVVISQFLLLGTATSADPEGAGVASPLLSDIAAETVVTPQPQHTEDMQPTPYAVEEMASVARVLQLLEPERDTLYEYAKENARKFGHEHVHHSDVQVAARRIREGR